MVGGIRKKVRALKKAELPKKSNFFPPFFWFILKQSCYNIGRLLILKLVPNDEE